MSTTAVSFSDTTQETPEVPPVSATFTAHDRCDTGDCGAQAYTRWTLETGHDLIFCFHHGNLAEPALMTKGFSMTLDERHKLVVNKLQGSEN